ncbi:S9 family peptidase [Halogeometricum luteum]|uniref:S9 family peptidase n=1 Tax=Halogeometricum luteum TaxID=2950537 RepID=A0ABU2G2Q4_9EURY|nr:S9 family peptidase [Halogeometricum sp. S3BR5-2]MDS0294458.1 S9 family peptidase [Halogeometricum sp. S3BR5-2]
MEPLDLDALFELRSPSAVTVSPDGSRAAFLLTESDVDADEERTSLFVVPTDGSRDPHRLTRVADAGSPAWGPDGDRLAFLAARDEDVSLAVRPEGGEDAKEEDARGADEADEDPKSQVWSFDLARGGDARQVTDFEEGVEAFDWGPDGDRLVVAARDPTDEQREYLERVRDDGPIEVTRTQHRVDGKGWQDDVRTYLFVVDRETREARRLDDAYARGARAAFAGPQPAWGPGERIAFVSCFGESPDETYAQDAYAISPDGTGLERLTDGGLSAGSPRWSPDGDRLAFAANDATNACAPTEVYVVDGAADDSGAVTVRSVSHSLDRTALGGPVWTDEGSLLARAGDGGRARLVALDADDPVRIFGAQGKDRDLLDFDAAGGRTAALLSHPSDGEDLFAASTDGVRADAGEGDGTAGDASADDDAELVGLTALNESVLADAALPSCERVRFEDGDGVEIEAVVYLPADFDANDPEPRATIAHVHGGPLWFDAPRFDRDYAYWTGRGYVVCAVNYRGSTSYGREFAESIRGEWGPREADDIVSGVEELVDRGWADPDRLFVSGFSQGGINTLHVVTRSDAFAAAAPEHGIYDFYSNFGTADMHQWYVNDLGYPWENPERYRDISTISDVDEIATPLLITAGEDDRRCPAAQAEQLYVSVSRAGVESKLVVYPGEHHAIGAPERAKHRLETLTEWFEAHDPANASGE